MDASEITPGSPMKWYQVWWHVWTHPGAEAFRTILRDPTANSSRGFVWIAVTSLITAVVYSLIYSSSRYFGDSVFFLLCYIILTPLFAIIGLAISAGIYRLIAGLFGGTGTWGELAYCFAAITAPASILAIPVAFLTPLMIDVDTTGFTLGPLCLIQLISLAVGIYSIVLFVSAIDGVENIGTGKAVLAYFIPVIVVIVLVFLLGICLVSIGILPVILEGLQ